MESGISQVIWESQEEGKSRGSAIKFTDKVENL